MKINNFLGLFLFFLFAFAFTAEAQVNPSSTYVSGYTRADGTYVSGHYKTTSNNTNRDNYTTKPNYNPHTGSAGYIQPDNNSISSPAYRSSVYSTSSNDTRSIMTGSRGGNYYINSNGNKTYVKY